MTLYEANYIKLIQLIPNLTDRSGVTVSTSDSDCDLHLTIEHHTKYSCELRLTYLFAVEGEGEGEAKAKEDSVADPDLVAKIYYDARMAEVRSWIDSHRHSALRTWRQQYQRELDQRWVRNNMLSKWLDYLQDRGHYFPL